MRPPIRQLIVNGDDLGASRGVSDGIFEAHELGILTSASLMVDRPAARDAVARAPATLGIGLHTTVTREGGELAIDPLECRAEIERQLEAFHELTGRAPTHLDAHHNVQRDPRLTGAFVDAARRHGLPLREHSAARYLSSFYGQWDGETHLEQVSVESLVRILTEEVGPGVTELGCHPGYVDASFRSSYAHEREAELRTLCDPAIRSCVESLGIRLISFAGLREEAVS